jgi:hypothetical protein
MRKRPRWPEAIKVCQGVKATATKPVWLKVERLREIPKTNIVAE